MDRYADLLRAFGRSTTLWVGDGYHHVGDDWWISLAGTSSVLSNVACCWSGRDDVLKDECLRPLLDLGAPGVIMLAGPGLARAQVLVDAGWIVAGVTPLMLLTREPEGYVVDSSVRELDPSELPAARSILAESFQMSEANASTALPDSVIGRDDERAWGLFEEDDLVAVVIIVQVDGRAVVWSMATPPSRQHSGLGRRLLKEVLHEEFKQGATASLLASSKAGEPLYRSLGYQVVGHLQVWSRPRWVLGSS